MSSQNATDYSSYTSLVVTEPQPHVLHVELNRPKQLNAMNRAFWREMVELFQKIDNNVNVAVVVISGRGRAFTAGLDVVDHADSGLFGESADQRDVARRAYQLKKNIQAYQESFNVIDKCHQPVIAVTHGPCVGGGIDMICACDIRLASADTFFTIAEIDIGMAADVGTLQRISRVCGNDSIVRELVYTGRRMMADEAQRVGLVSHVYANKDETLTEAMKMAVNIAAKSPVALVGCKEALNYARDHTIKDSLDQIALFNASFLQTQDIQEAIAAKFQKKPVRFARL